MANRYSEPERLTIKAVVRLVSLSSAQAIRAARQAGVTLPRGIKSTAQASFDPRTGRVFSKYAVQVARTYYRERAVLTSMRDATPTQMRRERVLQATGFTFDKRSSSSKKARDRFVERLEAGFRKTEEQRTGSVPTKKQLYRPGSKFEKTLDILTTATGKSATSKKAKALEALGLRPPGFSRAIGDYTPADLAAAWARAGMAPPKKVSR